MRQTETRYLDQAQQIFPTYSHQFVRAHNNSRVISCVISRRQDTLTLRLTPTTLTRQQKLKQE